MAPSPDTFLADTFGHPTVAKVVYKGVNLPLLLRSSMRGQFSYWGTQTNRATFRLTKNENNYNRARFNPDPDEVFQETLDYFQEIQNILKSVDQKEATKNTWLRLSS